VSSVLAEPAKEVIRRRPRVEVYDVLENGEPPAEKSPALEMSFPASESSLPLSEPDFSAEEIAKIAASIALGKGKTEILKEMPGYSGRNHKAYSLVYERLKKAVEEVTTVREHVS
jgi:hypothetical protein